VGALSRMVGFKEDHGGIYYTDIEPKNGVSDFNFSAPLFFINFLRSEW